MTTVLPHQRFLFLLFTILAILFLIRFSFFNIYVLYDRKSSISVAFDPLSGPRPASPSSPESTPKILLVSALFPLHHAKHTKAQYKEWLSRFLARISGSDIYFYTTPELDSLVRDLHALANATNTLTVNTNYSTPFHIPPLRPYREKYVEMHAWDREKERHSPELYAVWNAKPWFLDHALQVKTDINYDYAFWVDAGSFRSEHAYRAWPDPRRVEQVWKEAYTMSRIDGLKGKQDLMFIPVYELPGKAQMHWKKELGPVDIDFIEGSFFGSTSSTISWYTQLFYRYHDHYISVSPPSIRPSVQHPHTPSSHHKVNTASPPPFHFVGKDQTLINALVFLYPHRFFTVLAPQHQPLVPPFLSDYLPLPPPSSSPSLSTMASSPSPPALESLDYALRRIVSLLRVRFFRMLLSEDNRPCGDEWFYYQYWLASPVERFRMGRNVWPLRPMKLVRKFEAWVREFDGDGRGCPIMDVIPVEALLRALFGDRWVEAVRAWGE